LTIPDIGVFAIRGLRLASGQFESTPPGAVVVDWQARQRGGRVCTSFGLPIAGAGERFFPVPLEIPLLHAKRSVTALQIPRRWVLRRRRREFLRKQASARRRPGTDHWRCEPAICLWWALSVVSLVNRKLAY